MSEDMLIAYGDKPSDTAVLLLGAADKLGLEAWVVRNQPEDNGFRVPEEVAQEAGLAKKASAPAKPANQGDQVDQNADDGSAKKTPAKKTAAKKTAAKKTAAKNTSKE